MQIVENKALLLRLRNPKQVTAIIPKSRELPDNKVLVNWGLDEAKILKNLNIRVPSPIVGKYDWPGKYKPYQHQIDTAAFLTMHRKAFCFNEQGCVDSETEYLSPTGWVKISEYKGGNVAQYDPVTRAIEFVEPEEFVKLPCHGMIRIKTKYGIDQLLSPEHRVLLEDGKSPHQKQETLSADELLRRHYRYHMSQRAKRGGTRNGTDTIAFAAATIPTAFGYHPDTCMAYSHEQLRVLVAAIADGYFGSRTRHCVMRLKKERKKERLRALLNAAEIPYKEIECLPQGFSKFTFVAPERWKEFGPEFWNASAEQLQVITDEVLHWDGCTTRGDRFSTSSKASADFIQFAYAAQRVTARVLQRERRGSVEYTVQIRKGTERLYVRGSGETMYAEPSTDGFKYCFRVPSTYLVFRRNGCVFASGNTGKTAAAIWASDFLMREGRVRRVLIVCPLSIMDIAWRADLFSFAMHRTVAIAHGKNKQQILKSGADYTIINYNGVEILQDDIAAGGFDLVIVDEATGYKNPNTARWKALNAVITPDTWLWLMTGTPAAQSPLDAYGLAKLVNPTAVPRFFGAFRDQVMTKLTQFKWVPRPDATDTVFRVLQPAIRFTKEECLDLPERVYVKREVALTKQQDKYYKELRNKLVVQAAGEEITAKNAAISMNKLLQIASGAVYTDTKEVLEFDISTRYNVLKEVIEESSKKVLVFVPFKHAIDLLMTKLRSDGITAEMIRGDVPATTRTDVFNRFQKAHDPRVLVIQPQSAAHGVTLTAADTIVWWAPTSSLETYAQANDRIHRSGQTSKCTVVQLQGSHVERHIYSLLDKRIDVHSKIVELYKEILA